MKIKLCDFIGHRYQYDLTGRPLLRCCVRCGLNHEQRVQNVIDTKNGKRVPVYYWKEV